MVSGSDIPHKNSKRLKAQASPVCSVKPRVRRQPENNSREPFLYSDAPRPANGCRPTDPSGCSLCDLMCPHVARTWGPSSNDPAPRWTSLECRLAFIAKLSFCKMLWENVNKLLAKPPFFWAHLGVMCVNLQPITQEAFWLRPSVAWGLPWWLSGKESACQCRRRRFNPWVGKIPWSRKWQPTPVFLPGESHGQRSPAGYSPWGRKKSDMTENTQEVSFKYTWFLKLLPSEINPSSSGWY